MTDELFFVTDCLSAFLWIKQYQYFTNIIQRENKDKKDFIG